MSNLEIKNLNFSYNKKTILNNITFSIKPNMVNVLIGLNGAGKTTLFDCMTGVLKAKKGFMNVPSSKEILYLTQSLFFSSNLKGKDFLKLIMRLDNQKIKKNYNEYITEYKILNENKFLGLSQKKFKEMSIGEKRWFILNVVLMIERKLYILDEPTTSVDPLSRLKIMEKIDELSKKIIVLYQHTNCKT